MKSEEMQEIKKKTKKIQAIWMRQWYALKFAQQIGDLARQPTQYFQLDMTNPFYLAVHANRFYLA